MKIVIVSSVRLFREGLAASLASSEPDAEVLTEPSVTSLYDRSSGKQADVVLVDVTQGVDLEEVGMVAAKFPALVMLALGLPEKRDEVVRHGRAGFRGYVVRDASLRDLQSTMADAVTGRLQCSAEITGGLIRALFNRRMAVEKPKDDPVLTDRESEVLHLIGRGLSNKEIARDLELSVATVKCHVHNVFAKLGVAQRAYAMRRVRAAPWIATKSR